MAEGGYDPRINRQKKPLCRYYMHGSCRKGTDCNFVHSRDGTAPLNNICKFYQLGICSYGKHCRYEHVKPSRGSQSHQNGERENNLPRFTPWNGSAENDSFRSANENDGKENDSFRSTHINADKGNNSWRPGPRNEGRSSNMVVLKKEGFDKSVAEAAESRKQRAFEDKWVKASDFVPGQKYHKNTTYASTAKTDLLPDKNGALAKTASEPLEEDLLCPYYAHGRCPYEDKCHYLHGDICDICNYPRLHPTDDKLREVHKKECLAEMEKDMELSFAVQESKDKECCICLEMVMEKAKSTKSDSRFGILENCNHCFCLSCIRRWRGDKSFGKNVRVCPICRVHSDFVTPSKFWIEEEDKKKKLIEDYKAALKNKPCQYFKLGKGECPFNEKCFYRHAYPDGTIAQPKPRKRRRRVNADGDETLLDTPSLWSFLEHRDSDGMGLDDELSLFLSLVLTQDSDDDDWAWDLNFTDSGTDSDSTDWGL